MNKNPFSEHIENFETSKEKFIFLVEDGIYYSKRRREKTYQKNIYVPFEQNARKCNDFLQPFFLVVQFFFLPAYECSEQGSFRWFSKQK